MCLLTIKDLRGVEVGEIFVVSKDLYGEWESMEIVLPGFQGSDDSEEFPVIDIVVLFGRGEGLGKVGAGMSIAI